MHYRHNVCKTLVMCPNLHVCTRHARQGTVYFTDLKYRAVTMVTFIILNMDVKVFGIGPSL